MLHCIGFVFQFLSFNSYFTRLRFFISKHDFSKCMHSTVRKSSDSKNFSFMQLQIKINQFASQIYIFHF